MPRVQACVTLAIVAGALCLSPNARAGAPEAPVNGGDAAKLSRDPVASTYSIVARDPASGALGVAVQSHWFQVGPIVPWAEAGVGAVATQSLAEVSYGPKALALMRHGIAAGDALEVLVEADASRDVRQVAIVDAAGRVAAWTGPKCIPEAGQRTGDGYSVQANLMAAPGVPEAMERAWLGSADEPFAERLLRALEAAEAAGGDIRGKQSAALIVVRAQPSAEPWTDTLVDLRVDDAPDPLAELRRLYTLHRAYAEMNLGDAALGSGDLERAQAHYAAAASLAPGVDELRFWQAVTLFTTGHEDEALALFGEVFAGDRRWIRVAERLPTAGLLPADPEKLKRILSAAD